MGFILLPNPLSIFKFLDICFLVYIIFLFSFSYCIYGICVFVLFLNSIQIQRCG